MRTRHRRTTTSCCSPTTVAVFREETLVDIQVHHHCGRTREHIQPRDWWAAR